MDAMDFIWDEEKNRMEIRYQLKEDAKLTEEQIREIEAARNCSYVADDDCPEIDPEKTPELYEGFLKSLGERNRKLSKLAL